MRRSSFMWCCMLGLSLTHSLAQLPPLPPENKWELSFFAGSGRFGNGSFVTPVQGGSTQTVALSSQSGAVAGVRVTENLGERFGAELEYARASHALVFTNLKAGTPSLGVDHKVHKLAYSVLYYPFDRGRRIRPYGSVGAGASLSRISGGSRSLALKQGIDLKDRWTFAYSYGAGVKVQLGKNWGVRGDFRDQVARVPDFGLPGVVTQNQPGFRPEGSFHNWQISAGIMYTFERR